MNLPARAANSDDLPQTLDPLLFPLHGSSLIEASAGTGKTYTIAALYVRLILGHGGDTAYARALTPPEILVVTFTDAATKELRMRIRNRLSESASCFYDDPGHPVADQLLQDLRSEYAIEQWPACARKLQLAAEWMDEAAVSTIHGWCNRMLREHAFDSDSLFTQTLEPDQSEILAEVVRDYWRSFMAPLTLEAASEILPWWTSPEDLQKKLRNLMDHAQLLEPTLEPAAALQSAFDSRMQILASLKSPWQHWVDELEALLVQAVADKKINGRKLQARYFLPWLSALRTWAADPQQMTLELNSGWSRLTPDGMAEAWITGEPPNHPAFSAIASLQHALNNLPNARADLLRHAAHWVAERFATELSSRALMGFNDLLSRLDDALQGPNRLRLANIIQRQFPVALIDEFQDTDPLQYRIFDAIYGVADNNRDTALVLIGDPKQAIYAFRGADIYTYLAARLACRGRLYTLKKNYRSTRAMVNATNACFELAEAAATGGGAFLFRSLQGNPVPFIAAEAKGRDDCLQVNGMDQAALTAWWLPCTENGKPIGRQDYQEQMAAACASEMVRLLRLGQSGMAGLVTLTKFTALCPADMAVLVNNRTEAQAMKAALSLRGVRSVYLSDNESVFQSRQAEQLQHWLAACAEPDDGNVLRAALATSTLGLDWTELDALNHNEQAWDARLLQFREYRECWKRQGVLPMLRRLLNDFSVPTRLLALGTNGSSEGERTLTNILHLAELLQQASIQQDGEHALIRYLAEQRQEARKGAVADARQIRLESDADLVKIVTIHKSKGLEYPLVFLPYASNFRATKADDLPLKYHDAQGQLQLALSDAGVALEQADRERLGEDLRKLYVALTRARYATWVGLAPLEDLERSAFGYLLSGGQVLLPDGLEPKLQDLREACQDIAVVPAPDASPDRILATQLTAVVGSARIPTRAVHEHWWVASYSALNMLAAGSHHAAETPTEDIFLEAQPLVFVAPSEPVENSTGIGSLHSLPRGAETGSFLHDLLESVARLGFARASTNPRILHDLIEQRCALRGWESWVEPLFVWMERFISTPLQIPALCGRAATRFTLAGLVSPVAEMEFWLAADSVAISQLDRLICANTLNGEPRPALLAGQLNGMLKGFIDLVFEHEGRYYILDYKSNCLGPNNAAYTPETMRAEILQSRYELQYVLYLFALHRLLKARLPDYDYDLHVGAAVYVFLRGLQAPAQGLHVERPPRALMESLDELFSANHGMENA